MFIFKRFGLCPQEEDGIEESKMAENSNSECDNDFNEQSGLEEKASNTKEILEELLSHEEKQLNEAENKSAADNTCDRPVEEIVQDNENTDELHSQSIGKVDSVDAIVDQYKNNNDDGFSVAPDNDLIVAQKNCNDEESGGKHQFYCQEIPTQAQLAESSPLNSKLKYRGEKDRSKEG